MKSFLLLICFILGLQTFSEKAYSQQADGLFDNTFFFKQCYFGIDGGWGTGLSISDRDHNSGNPAFGANFGVTGMRIRAGYHAGANVGCIINPYVRTDISYNFLSNPVSWATQFFGAASNAYDAKLHTHLVLWNAYVHLDHLRHPSLGFSPYLTGGVGAAVNDLQPIKAFDNTGVLFAFDDGKTRVNFAARFGLGLLRPFCCHWALDMGFNINYIGNVRTGNRETSITGTTQRINPYKEGHNWVGLFYVGLKYLR